MLRHYIIMSGSNEMFVAGERRQTNCSHYLSGCSLQPFGALIRIALLSVGAM